MPAANLKVMAWPVFKVSVRDPLQQNFANYHPYWWDFTASKKKNYATQLTALLANTSIDSRVILMFLQCFADDVDIVTATDREERKKRTAARNGRIAALKERNPDLAKQATFWLARPNSAGYRWLRAEMAYVADIDAGKSKQQAEQHYLDLAREDWRRYASMKLILKGILAFLEWFGLTHAKSHRQAAQPIAAALTGEPAKLQSMLTGLTNQDQGKRTPRFVVLRQRALAKMAWRDEPRPAQLDAWQREMQLALCSPLGVVMGSDQGDLVDVGDWLATFQGEVLRLQAVPEYLQRDFGGDAVALFAWLDETVVASVFDNMRTGLGALRSGQFSKLERLRHICGLHPHELSKAILKQDGEHLEKLGKTKNYRLVQLYVALQLLQRIMQEREMADLDKQRAYALVLHMISKNHYISAKKGRAAQYLLNSPRISAFTMPRGQHCLLLRLFASIGDDVVRFAGGAATLWNLTETGIGEMANLMQERAKLEGVAIVTPCAANRFGRSGSFRRSSGSGSGSGAKPSAYAAT